MAHLLRVLCFGDIVGRPGRDVVRSELARLRTRFDAHLVIVNGENASGGGGLDPGNAQEIRALGVDVITLGDHTWQRRQIRELFERDPEWCIRPANYPPGLPGRGWTVVSVKHPDRETPIRVGVGNLMGRVMMSAVLDCPFRAADRALQEQFADVTVRIIDFHAEATSEKVAMLRYLSGRVSLLFGTHTHVPTADAHVDSRGTAYVTDLGMCGPRDSVIGMDSQVAINRFLTGGNIPYEVAESPATLNGVYCEIDIESGKAVRIERVDGGPALPDKSLAS